MQALHIFNASIAFLASTWHKKKKLGHRLGESLAFYGQVLCRYLPGRFA